MPRKGFRPTKPAMGCLIFLGLVLAVGIVNDLRGPRPKTSAPLADLVAINRARVQARVTPEPTKTAGELAKAEARQRESDAREVERKRQDGIKARALFATKILDRIFLEIGRDVQVSVEGKENTVLRLRWVLWSRVTVYQQQKDREFMDTLRAIGFKKVIYETGYGDSWNTDL